MTPATLSPPPVKISAAPLGIVRSLDKMSFVCQAS